MLLSNVATGEPNLDIVESFYPVHSLEDIMSGAEWFVSPLEVRPISVSCQYRPLSLVSIESLVCRKIILGFVDIVAHSNYSTNYYNLFKID